MTELYMSYTADNDPPWTLEDQQNISDEFDELQRTLTAELEGLESFAMFAEEQEDSDEGVSYHGDEGVSSGDRDKSLLKKELQDLSNHGNTLSFGSELRQKSAAGDSAISDSPPPSPPDPELMKMETESSDTGLPGSQPPSYTSSRTPDLDYYPTKYSSSSPTAYSREVGTCNSRPSAFTKYNRDQPCYHGNSDQPEHERLLRDYENGYSGQSDHDTFPTELNSLSDRSRDIMSRDRVSSDGAILRHGSSARNNNNIREETSQFSSPPSYNALSPKPCPQSRGYASSMPFLDSDHYNADKRVAGRSHSPVSECSRTTNTSRISLAKRAIHNSHHHHGDAHRYPADQHSQAGSSAADQIDLPYILQILNTSSNSALLANAAGCIQHLVYNQDGMKNRIREMGGIPVLVRLLQAEQEVCLSALGALRNLSYGQQHNLNKIAIKDSHGVPLLVQLLKSSENFEIQELVTGVFWNLSSSEQVKSQILRQALEPLVKNLIIPQSGWKGSQIPHERNVDIDCTTVFRNATGCLRNLSSAGLEGRAVMRSCPGLVDSLLFTLRAVQGKNDVDNKAVENSICILRNLSYRLDAEVSPEHKYGQVEDWRSKGLGGGQFKRKEPNDDGCFKRKKNSKKHKGKENATPLPEHTAGVGLLWQPSVVRIYLDLLLECSNPESLEGAAGALQNLTASTWEPAAALREAVRKEKGLSVITSLLRMPNDPVVRATAVCLRNLAMDTKNKDLLGRNALHNLIKRLPGGDGADGITDVTIGAILSAIYEVMLTPSPETCRVLKEMGGIPRLVEISRATDVYSGQCVYASNRVLSVCWDNRELRKSLKNEGWNIAMSQRGPPPDKTDGLEYDDSRNQFKASYNNGLNTISRPGQDSLMRHVSPGSRRHQSPSSPRNYGNRSRGVGSPGEQRAATMGRSFDPSLEYHRPDRPFDDVDMSRGHSLPARSLPPTRGSLPPAHPLNTNYGVADSWV